MMTRVLMVESNNILCSLSSRDKTVGKKVISRNINVYELRENNSYLQLPSRAILGCLRRRLKRLYRS